METPTTQTLQELINKKAIARLNSDLEALEILVNNTTILSEYARGRTGKEFPLFSMVIEPDKNIKMSLTQFFHQSEVPTNRGLMNKALYEYWLPIYMREETERFIQIVEKLETDVNNLLEVKNDDEY